MEGVCHQANDCAGYHSNLKEGGKDGGEGKQGKK